MAILRGRAPLRLGLGGGGTDVEPYSSQFGGRILSVTIDKYAYAFAERGTGDEIAFRSPDRDRAGQASIDDLASLEEDFPLHVAVYRRVIAEFNGGTPFPLQLATQVDAPPGSGLGSSSALVVAMLLTTCALIGSSPGPYELARLAWEIERVDLGMAGGWQDHYAAAFGGFNFMESRPNGEVVVNPLRYGGGDRRTGSFPSSVLRRRLQAVVGSHRRSTTQCRRARRGRACGHSLDLRRGTRNEGSSRGG